MADVPPDDTTGPRTDEFFHEEYHVSAAEAGEFLVDLGERLQAGDDVTVSGEDWELPFAYREPVELEIEYVGTGEAELEIELELSQRRADETPPSLG
ncbi:MAG: amphi-Trp domain-containing protein [Haloplanus sp.]